MSNIEEIPNIDVPKIYEKIKYELNFCIKQSAELTDPRIKKLREILELLLQVLEDNPPEIRYVENQQGGARITNDVIILFFSIVVAMMSGMLMWQNQPLLSPAMYALSDNMFRCLGNNFNFFSSIDSTPVTTRATIEYIYDAATEITAEDRSLMERKETIEREMVAVNKELTAYTVHELSMWENIRNTPISKEYEKELQSQRTTAEDKIKKNEDELRKLVKKVGRGHRNAGMFVDKEVFRLMNLFSNNELQYEEIYDILNKFQEGIKNDLIKQEFDDLYVQHIQFGNELFEIERSLSWFKGKGASDGVLHSVIAGIYGSYYLEAQRENRNKPPTPNPNPSALVAFNKGTNPLPLDVALRFLKDLDIPAKEYFVAERELGWILTSLGIYKAKEMKYDHSNFNFLRGELTAKLTNIEPDLANYMILTFSKSYYQNRMNNLKIAFKQTMITSIDKKIEDYNNSVALAKQTVLSQLPHGNIAVYQKAELIIRQLSMRFVKFNEKTIAFVVEESQSSSELLNPAQKEIQERRLDRIGENENQIIFRLLSATTTSFLVFLIMNGIVWTGKAFGLIALKYFGAPIELVDSVAERIRGRPNPPLNQLLNAPAQPPALPAPVPAQPPAIPAPVNAQPLVLQNANPAQGGYIKKQTQKNRTRFQTKKLKRSKSQKVMRLSKLYKNMTRKHI